MYRGGNHFISYLRYSFLRFGFENLFLLWFIVFNVLLAVNDLIPLAKFDALLVIRFSIGAVGHPEETVGLTAFKTPFYGRRH
jgi:hypothetical protein